MTKEDPNGTSADEPKNLDYSSILKDINGGELMKKVVENESKEVDDANSLADQANKLNNDLLVKQFDDMDEMMKMVDMSTKNMDAMKDRIDRFNGVVDDAARNAMPGESGQGKTMAEQLMGETFTVRGDGGKDLVEEHNRRVTYHNDVQPPADGKTVEEEPELTDEERRKMYDEGMTEIESLTGLESVKRQIKENLATINALQERKKLGLLDAKDKEAENIGANIVFLGNPGTGKTTVARSWAKVLAGIGVLKRGQLIETDRSGLVAGYQGQTAIKTRDVVMKALGGALFIDEFYSLLQSESSEDTFGKEAISTLLKLMEDHRGEFIVIIAGYTDLMERALDSNPGLRSRFTEKIEFTDYTNEELKEIFKNKAARKGIKLTDSNLELVDKAFDQLRPLPSFANGRTARVLLDNAMKAQSMRYSEIIKGDATMTDEDRKALIQDWLDHDETLELTDDEKKRIVDEPSAKDLADAIEHRNVKVLTTFTDDDIKQATERTVMVSKSLESKSSQMQRALKDGDFTQLEKLQREMESEEDGRKMEDIKPDATDAIHDMEAVQLDDDDADDVTEVESEVKATETPDDPEEPVETAVASDVKSMADVEDNAETLGDAKMYSTSMVDDETPNDK